MTPILAALALAFSQPAGAGSSAQGDFTSPRDKPAVMEARVEPRQDGRFDVSMTLRDDAPVWLFLRSNGPISGAPSWREGSWEVLTPGIELTRIGLHEVLMTSDGSPLPREVRVAVKPYHGNLVADYQPAIRIGPRAIALFSDHFLMRPAADAATVRGLGADWTVLPDYDAGHPLARFSGEDWLVDGAPARDIAVTEAEYVLHGTVTPGGNEAIVTYIDPTLPDWLGARLSDQIPDVLDLYAGRWGPHADGTPELLVEWAGPTPGTVSLGGSVIGSQLVMRLEGQALLAENGGAGREVATLIAHEAAHFWLGNLVAYGRPGDAWTSEGGADLAALRALGSIDPGTAERRNAFATRVAWRQCASFLGDGGLSSAPERGQQKAFYSCGFLLSLAAEEVARRRGTDFFGFWSALIEANREDGEVDGEDWFDGVSTMGASPATLASMRTIVQDGGGEAALVDLFEAAGLPLPRFGEARR